MATAERRRWLGALPFVGLIAGGVAFTIARSSGSDDNDDVTSDTPLAVEAASQFQFASLEELLVASDAVVVGVVETTSRGRLIGDPETGGVVSRIVTLRIQQVISASGSVDLGDVVLVEEEGWLPDGTPIEVNGVRASREGDRGLWFLDQVAVDDVPALVVINSQGRYLAGPGGSTIGGDQRDPLVQVLQERAFDELVALAIDVAKEPS